MAITFPTSLDALTNPTGSSSLTSPDHATQHSDANDAIEAIQAKLGVDGSAVTSSVDYKITNNTPTGVVNMWMVGLAPTGWLLCDGTAISRTTYSALFGVLGVTYGVGDGSTTFNIPNMVNRVPVGKASTGTFATLGSTGGVETVTLTVAQLAAHGHAIDAHNHTQNAHNHTQDSHNHTQDTHNHTQDGHSHTQDGHAHTVNAHSHLNYYTSGSGGSHSHTYKSTSVNRGTGSTATITTVAGSTENTSTVAAHDHANIAYTGDTSPATNSITATNQANTATNQTKIATNQATTATNIANTATNIATATPIASTGGDTAHTNLQPYIVINYIIKA
jgi:microcystin-dependent protein